ncbi:hypothetical protein [Nocardia sp. bgisy118]|uniref:hypothetical protein n=1 Tax=Nocardia sp. bgisy118 TaxID=3413786 RepID=UPI003F4A822C
MTRLVDRAMYIIAETSGTAINVFRSPIVRDQDVLFQPVREHIRQHGLVLAWSETFEDSGWMFGELIAEIYTTPDRRADIMDCELHSDVFEACGICNHFHDLDAKHQMAEPGDCAACIGFHR